MLPDCSQVTHFHTTVSMPKCESLITATTVDPARRRLWTGQQDGTITLHLDSQRPISSPLTHTAAESSHESSNSPTSPDSAPTAAQPGQPGSSLDPGSSSAPAQPFPNHSYATTGAPTTCMSVDEDGTLWVGDRSGRVTRLRPAGHILPVTSPASVTVNSPPAVKLSIRSMTPAAATFPRPRERFPSVRTVVPSGCSGSAEICAILATPNSGVFAADVSCQLFRISAELCVPVQQASCSAYGRATALLEIPWLHSQRGGCSSSGTNSGSHSAGVAASQRNASLPVMPEGESLPSFLGSVSGLQQPVERWRLLSGHTNGQILVWSVTGGTLNLAAVIGVARPAVIAW